MDEVIMPALGMTQDTGKLVQWLKQSGDPVAVGDLLFEVETDKSVMEVEAQASGFLTQVSAAGGDDVPVGQIIARITATADDTTADPTETATPTAPVDSVSAPTPVATAPITVVPTTTAAATPSDRIFASPKTRRVATEEGLDLRRLAATGQVMPYHVADLEILRTLPETSSGQTVVMEASKQITARTSCKGAHAFVDWMHEDGAITVTSAAMFVSFAASAWRAATEVGTVAVYLSAPEGDDITVRNPDFARLSAPPQETDDAPSFVLHDLSDSFLTSLRLGDARVPTLSIGSDGESYFVTFEFGSGHLSDDQAIAFITGFARRLSDPLRHLV